MPFHTSFNSKGNYNIKIYSLKFEWFRYKTIILFQNVRLTLENQN